jgi:hypothetical protein
VIPHISNPRRRARNPSRSDIGDTLTSPTRPILRKRIADVDVDVRRGGRRVIGTRMKRLREARKGRGGEGQVNPTLIQRASKKRGEDILQDRNRNQNHDLYYHPRLVRKIGSRKKRLEWLVNLPW